MARLNMVAAINLALEQEMQRDEHVVIMGEDVGRDGGVFRVTDGLLDKFGPQRVIDTPLAESAIIGTAIGMAVAGLRPVAEMQFSGFSYLMLPQLEGNASRLRHRSQGTITVPLVVRMPYGGGVRALEHHSESREAMYASLPGTKVVIPSGPRNARSLLAAAIRDPDPVVFMEPKHSYRAFKEEVPDEPEVHPLGVAEVVREGRDLTVISWGAMMRPTLRAIEDVTTRRGVDIEIIDLLSIAPMDTRTLVDSVRKTGRCVVVQEAPKTLGPASEIIARINDEVLLYLEAPVKRITQPDVVTPYFGREKLYLPNADRIGRAIEETLDSEPTTRSFEMYEFTLPDLGEGIREGEILKWHVEQGGSVEEDAPLVDVETDKAAVTIPSPKAGTVSQRFGAVGDQVAVGAVLVVIDSGADAASHPPSAISHQPATPSPSPSPDSPSPDSPAPTGLPIPAAPATRRLARELGVLLEAITPTGPAGRVTPEDVRRHAAGETTTPSSTAPPTLEPGQIPQPSPNRPLPTGDASSIPYLSLDPLPDFSRWGPVRTEPIRSVRRAIARNMTTSKILAPHVAHVDEADVTDLEALRRRLNTRAEADGRPKLTLLSFLVRAVTAGLQEFPALNASVDHHAGEIVYKDYFHLGFAADTERGLVVPVVRDVDRKPIHAIAAEIAALATRAREGTLGIEDMQGGTFTITNVGRYSGTIVVPAINYPEVGILGMGRVEEKPVVRDGEIVIRTMLGLTLSFDHRVVDGALAARFVHGLVRRLSDPERLLVEI